MLSRSDLKTSALKKERKRQGGGGGICKLRAKCGRYHGRVGRKGGDVGKNEAKRTCSYGARRGERRKSGPESQLVAAKGGLELHIFQSGRKGSAVRDSG